MADVQGEPVRRAHLVSAVGALDAALDDLAVFDPRHDAPLLGAAQSLPARPVVRLPLLTVAVPVGRIVGPALLGSLIGSHRGALGPDPLTVEASLALLRRLFGGDGVRHPSTVSVQELGVWILLGVLRHPDLTEHALRR